LSVSGTPVKKIKSSDIYPDLEKSDSYVFTSEPIRSWDRWHDGSYYHVYFKNRKTKDSVDITKGVSFHVATEFDETETISWGPESHHIYYVAYNQEEAFPLNDNPDIYKYNIHTGKTENLTFPNKGFDSEPRFSRNGILAYLQGTPGFLGSKRDIVVLHHDAKINLTTQWDGTVKDFIWAKRGDKLYFTADINGTIQVFQVNYPVAPDSKPVVKQLSEGEHDITEIIAELNDQLIITLTTMNRAPELYSFHLKTKKFSAITHINDTLYNKIKMPKTERRYVTTKDGKEMLVWVVYPPDFDAGKKYPVLLYAQGGPHVALSQAYSFGYNFQLMASKGCIVVAPNRRGVPGFGVEWDDAVAGNWGDLAMQDYVSAIDDIAREPYVNRNRMGAVGASFGGYSIYWLAGNHDGRFRTLIAHSGIFNTRSYYGTTDGLHFLNYEMGGPYWSPKEDDIPTTFDEYNPINYVQNWDTPILIIQGGRDYRVPLGQGLEAFQAAQLRGIKSRLLYQPNEGHWIGGSQNIAAWYREIFRWLEETLK